MKIKGWFLLFIFWFLLGCGCWAVFYHWQNSEMNHQKKEGRLFADLLMAENRFALERHIYPALETVNVEKRERVYKAIIVDSDDVILAPHVHFGKRLSQLNIPSSLLRLESDIVIHDESRERAIVWLYPEYFSHSKSWLLLWIAATLFMVGGIYVDRAQKKYSILKSEEEPLISWLLFLKELTMHPWIIFDERGNILKINSDFKQTHIIDLLPVAHQAQNVLREMKQMTKGSQHCVPLDEPKGGSLGYVLDEKKNPLFVLGLPSLR